MAELTYQYSAAPTRNPFRWLLAAWRVSRDLTNTHEAAIVEIGFSRSRLGRRFAGWGQVVTDLCAEPESAQAITKRHRLGPINVQALAAMPVGTLGQIFGDHCQSKSLDPNLVSIPADNDEDYVMAHMFETHDIWHVVTGWGNDELGEIGLGGFYLAQMNLPLIALMLALILLNTIVRQPTTLRTRMDALVAGFQMGKEARSLFGVRWDQMWDLPLGDIRLTFGLTPESALGEGVLAAA
jgi:ubiquinone biosynthesis protein COQ4